VLSVKATVFLAVPVVIVKERVSVTNSNVPATGVVSTDPDVNLSGATVVDPAVKVNPVIVLFVNVSDPAKVANVPVVGRVTLVDAVEVRVRGKAPAVVNAAAVDTAPPSVIV
jgi:hypothetical protein